MVINKEVTKILKKSGIASNDGLAYLIAIYFDIVPSYTPTEISQTIIKLKIFEWDNLSSSIKWNMSLFETQETKFDWVKSYRDAFRKINPDRGGSLSTCISRMKKFFSENPEVRVEEVNHAVGMYFMSVRDPQYLISAHKFIYAQTGAMKSSPLEEWIERYRSVKEESDNRNSITNILQ